MLIRVYRLSIYLYRYVGLSPDAVRRRIALELEPGATRLRPAGTDGSDNQDLHAMQAAPRRSCAGRDASRRKGVRSESMARSITRVRSEAMMISLPYLRHAFAAGFGAIVLVILMAGFVIPTSVIVCGPPNAYVMLARPVGATILSAAETDLSITVREDGTLLIGNMVVPAAQFQAQLTEVSRRAPGRRLVVRPDRRSPFGATRFVVRSAQSLGFRKVTIEAGTYSVAETWHR